MASATPIADGRSALLADAERADGHRPLSDHLWLDLVSGGRAGFAGVIAGEPTATRLVAYAQAVAANDVVDRRARRRPRRTATT